MLPKTLRRLVTLSVIVLVATARPSGAVPTVTITEFTAGITGAVGQVPGTIAAGPDGNVWFTEYNQSIVGKITPSGEVTEYQLPDGHNPFGITAGPDGNVWVAIDASEFDPQACEFGEGSDKIAKITPDGQVTMYETATPHGKPSGITVGPDGALWYALSGYLCLDATVIGGGGIGRITTAGVASAFTNGFDPQQGPSNVAFGSDGRIWFTNLYDASIGAMTTAGAVTHFDLPPGQFGAGITAGPDGAVWFAINRSDGAIGRATTAGDLTFFTQGLPAQFDVWDITTGPDGELWFVGGANGLGQITTSGAITMVAGVSSDANPAAITAGPAGTDTLWYAGSSLVGRVAFPAQPTTTTTTPATTSTTAAPSPTTPTTPAAPVTASPRFTG